MADAADPDLDAEDLEDIEDAPAPEPVLLRSDVAGVAGLALNRPDQYNALSHELLAGLQAELDKIKDDPSVRVVAITGQGRAFCAGHDLKEMAGQRERAKLTELFGQCSQVMLSLTRLPQPVIALVDGVAAAAGCQLVAACDRRSPRPMPGSPPRASSTGCSARRRWWRCRVTSRASTPWRCC
jgi:1,4-dihydroxy-2-naphthoyl-CoA synthase